MKTKRLDFTFRPLSASSYVDVVGNIPNKQEYDSMTNSYEPDYTLSGSHLILQPHVSVYDADGIIPNGEVTSSDNLTNIVWTEILTQNNTTTRKSVTDSTISSYYTVTTTGANKGRLDMHRNVPSSSRIVLEFTADYYDTRTGDTLKIKCDISVEVAVGDSVTTLILDKPNTNMWNPFRDPQSMTFNVSLKVGTAEVAAASRTIVWEKQRSDGGYTSIGSDGQDDFGWSVSSDGSQFTQNMDYIGEMMNMRVRVATLNGNTISTGLLTEYFSIKRRLPDYDYDYIETPDNIEPGTNYIKPTVLVTDRNGRVENASDNLIAKWYTGAGTAVGNPTMELVALGFNPTISTSKINANGMVMGLEMTDRLNYRKAGIRYDAVSSPSGNPKAQGWSELSGNTYVKTNDTSVVSGKTYYAVNTSPSAVPNTLITCVIDNVEKLIIFK